MMLMFCVKQLIESPTLITFSSFFISDHILACFFDRVTQRGILNVELSDNQPMYGYKKNYQNKKGGHKEIKSVLSKTIPFMVMKKL